MLEISSGSSTFKITELSGDQFPDLEAAQLSARSLLAANLAEVLRRMIESGKLEIKDGRIIPKG